MEPQLQALNNSVEQIASGVKTLKEDNQRSFEDVNAKVKGLEALPATVDELKTNLAKLQTVFERPGNAVADEKKESAEQSKLFVKALKGSLTALSSEEVTLMHKGLSTDDLPNGGFLVPVGTAGVINGQIFESSPMRRIASVQATSFKSIEFDLDDDEAEAHWDGEGASSVTDTGTPETAKIEIVARKIVAEPAVTTEILQDSAWDMERWLAGKVVDKFSRTENRGFVVGTGKLNPKGFLTYPAWAVAGTYPLRGGALYLRPRCPAVRRQRDVHNLCRCRWRAVRRLQRSNNRSRQRLSNVRIETSQASKSSSRNADMDGLRPA